MYITCAPALSFTWTCTTCTCSVEITPDPGPRAKNCPRSRLGRGRNASDVLWGLPTPLGASERRERKPQTVKETPDDAAAGRLLSGWSLSAWSHVRRNERRHSAWGVRLGPLYSPPISSVHHTMRVNTYKDVFKNQTGDRSEIKPLITSTTFKYYTGKPFLRRP